MPMPLALCFVHRLQQSRIVQQTVRLFHPWFPQVLNVFRQSLVPQRRLRVSQLDHVSSSQEIRLNTTSPPVLTRTQNDHAQNHPNFRRFR
jgi:hypothetical protein